MAVQTSTELFVQAYSKPSTGLANYSEVSLGLVAPVGANGTGVTVSDTVCAPRRMRCTVAATVAMVDATTNGSQGTLLLGTFPEGNIEFLGAVVNLTIARVGTALAAGAAVIGSIGTVVPGVDTTLTGTEANYVASTACTLSAGAGTFAAVGVAAVLFDGTAGAKTINLNFDCPDADSSGNDSLTVAGTVDIIYMWLGDK
jgi:hypothetical protein